MKKEDYDKRLDIVAGYLETALNMDKDEAKEILQEAEIKHASTADRIFWALTELGFYITNKNELVAGLGYLNKLADNGIQGARAGEMLKHYFIVYRILNRKP